MGKRQKIKTLLSLVVFAIYLLLPTIFCSSLAHADKIYLKSGKVLDGKLLGQSERRYLFSLDTGDGAGVPISFFPDDVEKVELGKDTVEAQTPYLKDLGNLKIDVSDDESKVYEISLYKDSPDGVAKSPFAQSQLKKALSKEEAEYYEKYNYTLVKYADKFQVIQNMLANLTIATRDEFAQAREYMDQLYFELNNIPVPQAFKRPHLSHLASVKANYLAFSALEQGVLEEASKQLRISEETKEKAITELREIILQKQAAASAAESQSPQTPQCEPPKKDNRQGSSVPVQNNTSR